MHVAMEADTINSCLFIVGVRDEIWEQVAFELFIQPDNFEIGLTGRKHRWIKQTALSTCQFESISKGYSRLRNR